MIPAQISSREKQNNPSIFQIKFLSFDIITSVRKVHLKKKWEKEETAAEKATKEQARSTLTPQCRRSMGIKKVNPSFPIRMLLSVLAPGHLIRMLMMDASIVSNECL